VVLTTRASGEAIPRSRATRARDRSRVGGHLRPVAGFAPSESADTSSDMVGFAGPDSVSTTAEEIAGFALDSLGRPRPRTGIPAAFRMAAGDLPANARRVLDERKRRCHRPLVSACASERLGEGRLCSKTSDGEIERVRSNQGLRKR